MTHASRRLGLGGILAAWLATTAVHAAAADTTTILGPRDASATETLAAREIQRYVYLRTGTVVPIRDVGESAAPDGPAVLVADKRRPCAASAGDDDAFRSAVRALGPEQYLLRTFNRTSGPLVVVTGGDGVGTLYAAYRFAERIGVRFYLHGDVIPDERMPLELPKLDEKAAPLFETRGIQPFHDFPEGPDWWNLDDYKAIISQLPRLRMNFIGLHTYPEDAPFAEPAVWIGSPADIGDGDRTAFAYPSSWQSTPRGKCGYETMKASEFPLGSGEFFEHDAYAADVMIGHCPEAQTPEGSVEVFARAGSLLREAFEHAHRLGVKTCVGTETPLTVPKIVQARLKAAGKDPASPAVIRELYEGIFLRIARTYPIDYYWFWTPEGWTWSGTKEEQVQATITDLNAAIAAAKNVNAGFTLATCGWVLGPPNDRALFDKTLPKTMPVSCINRAVGMDPVEPGFAKVAGRPKWAIPWMEDDPALTQVQLWAGRMREDAADALRYGCTGLMGIHWRTRVLGPNVSALAKAAWDQSQWNPATAEPKPREEGPLGGQIAVFPNNPIAGTDDAPLYQTVRYNVTGYAFKVPAGSYAVTLRFCEPHYAERGKRAFAVKIQHNTVIESLDIFAKVGQNRATDYTFKDVRVTDGWLDIEFVQQLEFPCIAAIAIEGNGVTRKVNCGGPAYKDYAADWPAGTPKTRGLPADDFYADWAATEFGPTAGPKAAVLFAKIDGKLPRPSDWVEGPGCLKPDARPWEQVAKEFAFVDEFAALRPGIKGAGNLERFDYWLNQFACLRSMARINCQWAVFSKTMDMVKAEKNPDKVKQLADEALPAFENLVERVREAYVPLLASVGNAGEFGVVSNWNQHILPRVVIRPGQELAKLLGRPLPPSASLARAYTGPTRVFVPTLRGSVEAGEPLAIKAVVLAEKKPLRVAVLHRRMGAGEYAETPMTHVARGVYTVRLPAAGPQDTAIEYYVKVAPDGGDNIVFPPTAPAINQTVVVTPR